MSYLIDYIFHINKFFYVRNAINQYKLVIDFIITAGLSLDYECYYRIIIDCIRTTLINKTHKFIPARFYNCNYRYLIGATIEIQSLDHCVQEIIMLSSLMPQRIKLVFSNALSKFS